MSTVAPEHFTAAGQDRLPGLFGIEVLEVTANLVRSRLEVTPSHLGLNGYLHAGTIVALADTACGYGCGVTLPDGSVGFTTIELKVNFLGTTREGAITCEARLAHAGRTTQVWDATVADENSGKIVAIFRCTQLVLYPTQSSSGPPA